LKGFTARNSPDRVDLIPEGSEDGTPKDGYIFRGHFLDLRTLAFTLTDRGHSLKSACEAFGVEHGKQDIQSHGQITEEYIDYNRRDVLATSELAVKLLEEFDLHNLDLQETKAYSPASLGKAYLRKMGITPVLQRQPDFPAHILGYAQSAFYGGRTSAHIRKTVVPVVYTDFLSMYPTVNSLMGLWDFVTAERIEVDENCLGEIEAFLQNVKPEDAFDQGFWPKLTGFVRLVPDRDILPVRAKYGDNSADWQVGINHLHAGSDNPDDALWYSLPDVVASVILTGKVPKIVDAFRLRATGKLSTLKPVSLRSQISVDPASTDFFKTVIEQRKLSKKNEQLSKQERERLDKALKVLANATSYGIYAEMIREESDEQLLVKCHGIDPNPFHTKVSHPERPGEFCFPPLAALITGAAHLMLALLEHSVTSLGGTFAMEDTDSMAIVAKETGGLIPCVGGELRTESGEAAIRALSWEQVNSIVDRFACLNPYDKTAIAGSVLKIEEVNFDPATEKQREIQCFAISAKRYALFTVDQDGVPDWVDGKEHGLGHLLDPTEPGIEDRKWINRVWEDMILRALGFDGKPASFRRLPAVGRVSVSSPPVMRSFKSFNEGKAYTEQIKPFNFVLTCQVRPFGHPTGADVSRFHLIAPYEGDSRKWDRTQWTDQYSGKQYRISASLDHGTDRTARVKTFGDVLEEYEFHPESKCANAFDFTCQKDTVGLLRRRHVSIEVIKFVGKESNNLEDVEAGLIHSEREVYTEYCDPARDEWTVQHLPLLRSIPISVLMKKTGLSRRALNYLRAGRRPNKSTRSVLERLLKDAS
jgi:hypothetical protein